MADHDIIIVGSGVNSLVCAALLARAGHSVCLIERNDRLGGAIRTEELTLPGFRHDVMSCWYPLFIAGPGYAALKDDLHALGLEFCFAPKPSGVVLPHERHFVMHMDRQANAMGLDGLLPGEGQRHLDDMAALEGDLDLTFTLLGQELWSAGMAWRLAKETWTRGPTGLSAFIGDAMRSCRAWLEDTYRSPVTHAMFAPWLLHTGLGPDSLLSGHMGRVIAFTLEQIGMPVVKGGSGNIARIFGELVERHRGQILLNSEVTQMLVEGGRSSGVRLAGGETITARRAVICNVPPTRLYGQMLPEGSVPVPMRRRAGRYRFGRADMQIHIALAKPAQWTSAALNDVPGVHVTPGMDGVAQAVAEAERGLLPTTATIVAGQPAVHDPSRVPEGRGQLWIQLQELPQVIKGDAAGQIAAPDDGAWSRDVAERYADRIIDRLAVHIPGLKSDILARAVISPADLERLNPNLVGGDPYCGDCGVDQFALWRPFPGARGHKTPVQNLWHIGASTHPGPGLGGGSGYLVAQQLMR